MENGPVGLLLEMPAALSENPESSENPENGTTVTGGVTSTSELLCKINHPEDVGAVVTSFCKFSADGKIKEEVLVQQPLPPQPPPLQHHIESKFNELSEAKEDLVSNEAEERSPKVDQAQEEADLDDEMDLDDEVEEVQPPLSQEIKVEKTNGSNESSIEKRNGEQTEAPKKPKDIIVSIKDENSQSSSDDDDEDDDDDDDDYEEETNGNANDIKEENDEKEKKPLMKRSESYEDEDEEESDEASEEEDEEDSEPAITKSTLRARRSNPKADKAKQQRELIRQISRIVRKSENDDELTKEEEKLLTQNPKVFDEVSRRHKRRKTTELRKQEIEDSPTVLAKKCDRMAKAIQKAKYLIVYTGAGISTAANIPDYRGPNGVWTCLDQGRDIQTCDLARAEPTFTHMALFTLFKKGKLKHIVSQNCDGLHLRSGIPRYSLSEVHGNMFIEVCKQCKPMRPYLRLFDVTERTSKNKHNTMRRCHVCGKSLIDTIVHFGERGSIKWPINWDGASKAAEKADVIICLGSSLKVLRRYPWLWCMDRPKKHRPKLYIVNLQWTPKDSAATCKLNGRCDEVLKRVMAYLEIEVPTYYAGNDPLLTYATPLHTQEEHTTSREELIGKVKGAEGNIGSSESGNSGNCSTTENSTDSADLKSWSLDHAYLNTAAAAAANKSCSKSKGRLVKSKRLDYKNIMWPRDALYISYKEDKFEYINDIEAQGETAYYCDCCDPACQKKRSYSDSSEDDESEGATNEDEDDEDEDKVSTTSSSVDSKNEKEPTSTKTENNSQPKNNVNQPGWFGKGRRKRARC